MNEEKKLVKQMRVLRKPSDTEVEVILFKDRAKVTMSKYSLKVYNRKRRKYMYNVHTEFVYNGKQYTTCYSELSITKALSYAKSIFEQRNKYMKLHNYKGRSVCNDNQENNRRKNNL